MQSKLKQLRRLVENSFPEIKNFHEKVTVEFEKLDNAKSFWSDVYLAHLKWNEGVEEEVEIPDNVFMKIPRISENVLRCEDGSGNDELHQVLVYYTKKENLFFKNFEYGTIPNFPFPKIYFTEDITGEATGGLVAENLTEKVFTLEHIPGFSHDQVICLMDALAGFHGFLLKRSDRKYVEDFKEGAHGREVYAEQMQQMMFEEALTLEKVCPEIFGDGRIQNISWAFDYCKKNKASKEAISAIPGILVHGDLNVTNMLWKKNSKKSEIAALIDYQMAFIGSIAFDIIRILTLGLKRDVRREKTNFYLDHYYRTLSGFFDGEKVPFSIEELHRQYNLIYPFASNFTLFGISLYIKMYEDGTLGTPENKEECREELIDRALGIVEDIENLKKKTNF